MKIELLEQESNYCRATQSHTEGTTECASGGETLEDAAAFAASTLLTFSNWAFDEYQTWTDSVVVYPRMKVEREDGTWSEPIEYAYPAFGLADEAGECVGKVKKLIRDKRGEWDATDQKAISKELGDVLFYLARVAKHFDLSLTEVAAENVGKLFSRKARDVLHGSGDNR